MPPAMVIITALLLISVTLRAAFATNGANGLFVAAARPLLRCCCSFSGQAARGGLRWEMWSTPGAAAAAPLSLATPVALDAAATATGATATPGSTWTGGALSVRRRVGAATGAAGMDDLPATSMLDNEERAHAFGAGATPMQAQTHGQVRGTARKTPLGLGASRAVGALDLGAPRGLGLSTPAAGAAATPAPASLMAAAAATPAAITVSRGTRWVTVWGYPEGASDVALRHLEAFGDVEARAPGGYNWMYAKFATALSAARAAQEPSHVVVVDGARVMVGVALSDAPSSQGGDAASSMPPSSLSLSANAVNTDDLPRKLRGLCERLMAWALDW